MTITVTVMSKAVTKNGSHTFTSNDGTKYYISKKLNPPPLIVLGATYDIDFSQSEWPAGSGKVMNWANQIWPKAGAPLQTASQVLAAPTPVAQAPAPYQPPVQQVSLKDKIIARQCALNNATALAVAHVDLMIHLEAYKGKNFTEDEIANFIKTRLDGWMTNFIDKILPEDLIKKDGTEL